jgi:uncharacterized cofD-like protein
MLIFRLLYPGIKIKRWLLLGSIGIGICAIGAAYFIRKIFLINFPNFLPWYTEGILLLIIGISIILFALKGLFNTLSPLLGKDVTIGTIGETLYSRLSKEKGPKIVVIGGGTGLSVLLKGLKKHTNHLTAIIGVSDDGGSSGRLRRELGVVPPGDFRNCIVAMADEESRLPELFQYRFSEGTGLKDHSFGNLFLVAMTNLTGNFVQALSESSKVLAVQGQIAPATTANLKLSARLVDGRVIDGESNITAEKGVVSQLYIHPEDAEAYQPAVDSILEADLIVFGPGSLYTSILPNLMVPGIQKSILNAKAMKVYVCNVATEIGETQGFNVFDHVNVLKAHTSDQILDCVVANNNITEIGDQFAGEAVTIDLGSTEDIKVIYDDLIDSNHAIRHDPDKLASSLLRIINQN